MAHIQRPADEKCAQTSYEYIFYGTLSQVLVDGGLVHLKTDSNFLFTYTDIMATHNGLPIVMKTADLYHDDSLDDETRRILSIQTYYEGQWIERGLNIKYIKFRLPKDIVLSESGVEIAVDDYRSYHRNNRSDVEKRK